MTLIKSIEKADHSIFLTVFGLSDLSILQALQKKASSVAIKGYYDPRASLPYDFSSIGLTPSHTSGLLHQKILVIDESIVFLGSTNLTPTSLEMHDNLLIGCYSPELANFLLQNAPFTSNHIKTFIGGQDIELYLLPNQKALSHLLSLIRDSHSKIQMAVFTLTHPDLIEGLIAAQKRGVAVDVFLDARSSFGASKKAFEALKKAHVKIYLSQGTQLFHHKHILIDDRILVAGSANFTKAAFKKNHDCVIILYNLTKEQKAFLKKLHNIMYADGRD